MRDLGYTEADAQGWLSVVMFRLRGQVAELEHEAESSQSGADKMARISKLNFLV